MTKSWKLVWPYAESKDLIYPIIVKKFNHQETASSGFAWHGHQIPLLERARPSGQGTGFAREFKSNSGWISLWCTNIQLQHVSYKFKQSTGCPLLERFPS